MTGGKIKKSQIGKFSVKGREEKISVGEEKRREEKKRREEERRGEGKRREEGEVKRSVVNRRKQKGRE